jgi:hypothetical protein
MIKYSLEANIVSNSVLGGQDAILKGVKEWPTE